jgi:hypothetical protein
VTNEERSHHEGAIADKREFDGNPDGNGLNLGRSSVIINVSAEPKVWSACPVKPTLQAGGHRFEPDMLHHCTYFVYIKAQTAQVFQGT